MISMVQHINILCFLLLGSTIIVTLLEGLLYHFIFTLSEGLLQSWAMYATMRRFQLNSMQLASVKAKYNKRGIYNSF